MLSDDNIEELWVSINKGKFMFAGFNTFARAIEAAVLPELDVLCEYTGQNGMREWNDVGAWLRPGECIDEK